MVGRRSLACGVAVLFLLACSGSASAQITTASVAGHVADPQGSVVPGANVTLTSETRGTQTADVVTDATGGFTFVNVLPDPYTLQIAIEGFKTVRRTGLIVGSGEKLGLGPRTIQLGTVSESITVIGESPL